jgi:hypothetical protein
MATDTKKPKDKMMSPINRAILTNSVWNNVTSNDGIQGITNALAEQIEAMSNGSMKGSEDMLLMQAHTLDMLFNNLAALAKSNFQSSHFYPLFKAALKSQSQCSSTLETLAKIKNPPVVYAKQVNVASNQQINNNPPHTGKIENEQNELSLGLTHEQGQRLDFGTQATTSGINQTVATVET